MANPALIEKAQKSNLRAMQLFKDMTLEKLRTKESITEVVEKLKSEDLFVGMTSLPLARKLVALDYEPKDYTASQLQEESAKYNWRINMPVPKEAKHVFTYAAEQAHDSAQYSKKRKAKLVKRGKANIIAGARARQRNAHPDVLISPGPIETELLQMERSSTMHLDEMGIIELRTYKDANGMWFMAGKRVEDFCIPLSPSGVVTKGHLRLLAASSEKTVGNKRQKTC